MAKLLEVNGLCAGYGAAAVLEDVSFSLEPGASLALLGRNGMGKTTLLATLMGATRQTAGRLRFQGQDLAAVPSHRRAQAGLGWVPQERDIFASLSVEENLTVVARPGFWDVAGVYRIFPLLAERRANRGNELSGGEQQMLAVGRALMLNPALLLLDEPLEGLAPILAQEVLAVLAGLVRNGGMAIILVEQHAHQILPLTQHAIVLERGRIVHAGDSASLLQEPHTLDRWLGIAA